MKEAMKNEKDNNMGGDFVVVDRPGTLDGEGEVPKLLPKGIAKGGAKTKAPGAGLGPKKILEGPPPSERGKEPPLPVVAPPPLPPSERVPDKDKPDREKTGEKTTSTGQDKEMSENLSDKKVGVEGAAAGAAGAGAGNAGASTIDAARRDIPEADDLVPPSQRVPDFVKEANAAQEPQSASAETEPTTDSGGSGDDGGGGDGGDGGDGKGGGGDSGKGGDDDDDDEKDESDDDDVNPEDITPRWSPLAALRV